MKKSKTIKPITFKDLDLNAILSKVEEACIEIKKDNSYSFKHQENYLDLIPMVILPFHTEVLSISLSKFPGTESTLGGIHITGPMSKASPSPAPQENWFRPAAPSTSRNTEVLSPEYLPSPGMVSGLSSGITSNCTRCLRR